MKWKLRRIHPIALGWLLLLLLGAAGASTTSPPPDLLCTTVAPFHPAHWLGTDSVGRDVWASLLAGARATLLISLPAALFANMVGGLLGALAGFFGNTRLRIRYGWVGAAVVTVLTTGVLLGPLWNSLDVLLVGGLGLGAATGWLLRRSWWGRKLLPVPLDDIIQTLIAFLDSVPLLVLVLTVAAIQQPSLLGLIVLLTSTCWTTPARLLRAATLRTIPLPFIMAAEAAGLPPLRIVRKHIWPVIWPVLLARIPLSMALIIGLETTLSFLGVGLPPEIASWGRLLASSRLAPTAWWLIVCPGTAIFLTIWSLQALTKANTFNYFSEKDVTK